MSSMTLKHSSVPSSLRSAKFSGSDLRRAAGVEIAVLAGEVAAVGEVPGDDVGPCEPFDSRASGYAGRTLAHSAGSQGRMVSMPCHMPKNSLAASRIFSSTSTAPLSLGEFLDARFRHRADELGNVREPGFRGGSPSDGDLDGLARLRLAVPWNHRGERTAAAGRVRRVRRSRDRSARPSDWTTCVSYALVSIAISYSHSGQ